MKKAEVLKKAKAEVGNWDNSCKFEIIKNKAEVKAKAEVGYWSHMLLIETIILIWNVYVKYKN